jgi:hypothetical protein
LQQELETRPEKLAARNSDKSKTYSEKLACEREIVARPVKESWECLQEQSRRVIRLMLELDPDGEKE